MEPWPQIPDQGGPVYTAAQLVVVTFPGYGLTAQINAWAQELIDSGYLAAVGADYGISSVSVAAEVTMPKAAPATIEDAAIHTFILNQTANGTLPPPTSNTVYVLFYPRSTTIVGSGGSGNRSCVAFAGYHASFTDPATSQVIAYAVVADCGPMPLLLEDEAQGVEVAGSHEIVESITDPAVSSSPAFLLGGTSPWAMTGGEDADFCVGIPDTLDDGGNQAQRIWSNTLAAQGGSPCAPVPAGGLTAVSSVSWPVVGLAGSRVSIPMIAWSTDGSSQVSFNSYGSTFFKQTLVPPADMPTDGAVTPYTLALPTSKSALTVTGRIATQSDAGVMEAWWPVAMRVRVDAGP